MNTQLKADQLCGLLNYCLGLPVINRRGHIMASEIPVIVVGSWTLKIRKRAESWVEGQMRHCGMLPKSPKPKRGKPFKPSDELEKWLPPGWRVAMLVREDAA